MEKNLEPQKLLTEPLLVWYRANARDLPWRKHPTPYRVWISEIMLQQTRVSAVIESYQRFLAVLPTVDALAACEEDRLMKLWQGLGYYSRARNLQKGARQILERFGGRFPDTYEDIRSLSGVGDYTAGAIGSIAFGLPVPAVDGNVLRVFSRILADGSDIAADNTKQRYRQMLQTLIPVHSPGDYNQALMELGATVCLPNGAPLCKQCPARNFCRASLEGMTDCFPVKTPQKNRKILQREILFLFGPRGVALRRRPEKGLLAGLWEYPGTEGSVEEEFGPLLGEEEVSFGKGKHIFSHIEWHMTARVFGISDRELPDGWVWADREELRGIYSVPSAFRCFEESVGERLKTMEVR